MKKSPTIARPKLTYPMWLGRVLCGIFEGLSKLVRIPPLLSGARLKFMGLNLDYSIEKARRQLGYKPSVSFQDGIQVTMDWLRAEGRVKAKPD